MDKLRAQIHMLTLQLEEERDRHQTVVGRVLVFINYAWSSMVKYSNTGDILPWDCHLDNLDHQGLGAYLQSPHPS